jgi:hypothetical protein
MARVPVTRSIRWWERTGDAEQPVMGSVPVTRNIR